MNLTSLQLADSFLPVGTYTFSYGLETLVNEGYVEDTEDLADLIDDLLRYRFGPSEMVAVSNAYSAAAEDDLDGVERVDNALRAVTLPREPREASEKSGDRLLKLFDESADTSMVSSYAEREAPKNYSVALALVAADDGMTLDETGTVAGYSFVTDLLGAGMRLLSVGHHEAQTVLNDAKPTVEEVWREYREEPADEMSSLTYVGDVSCMRHEDSESRLFFS